MKNDELPAYLKELSKLLADEEAERPGLAAKIAALDARLKAERAAAGPAFEEWTKMSRLRQVGCILTEKIDGTNAQIYVPPNPDEPLLAGSRNRWLNTGPDNFGFNTWVQGNAEMLRRLGPGRHYGEWWGPKIGRGYGIESRRFSLFAANRWTNIDGTTRLPEGLPAEVGVVPVLYRGPYDGLKVEAAIAKLFRDGSVASPGWRGFGKEGPEGVVLAIDGAPALKLSDNGDAKKGRHHYVTAAAAALTVTRGAESMTVHGVTVYGGYISLAFSLDTDETAARMQVANLVVDRDAEWLDNRRARAEKVES